MFEPAGSISRVNAWWLAEASLAAYHAPARATAIFHAAGLHCEPLTAGPTEAYITYGAEAIIVVFRGTTPDRWEEGRGGSSSDWSSAGRNRGSFGECHRRRRCKANLDPVAIRQ